MVDQTGKTKRLSERLFSKRNVANQVSEVMQIGEDDVSASVGSSVWQDIG